MHRHHQCETNRSTIMRKTIRTC
uniref:Uncharacterized protein n=1 Tax=Rhizophora mucronata TaxID=61149 RepID=A0A2P2PHT9_RHIMU